MNIRHMCRTSCKQLVVWTLGLWVVWGLAGGAWAQGSKAPTVQRESTPQQDQAVDLTRAAKKKKAKKQENGWYPKLSLGVNVLLNHSANVPGVDDGFTFSLGVVLTGELLYLYDKHEWKSSLKGVHTQTKTPNIDPFVKTADNIDLRSFYTYRFGGAARIGVFVGAQLSVALLPGALVVAQDTQTVLIDGSDRQRRLILKNDAFQLTPAFSPLILKQKAGLDSKPFEDKFATLDLKFSAAAQEVIASGAVIQDDAATTDLELVRLRNYAQLGAEIEIKLSGSINKRVTYEFFAELMYPFITSIDTDLQGFDLLNADLQFKVGVKLAKFASLDYVFAAKLVPLLARQWQVTNNLVLSLKADIF